MVSATSHAVEALNAIYHAMKKRRLAMLFIARWRRTKSQKIL
jgi:hypothetical protein